MLEVFNRPYPDPVQLPLATGPWPPLLITAAYLLFVLKLGRQFMANRAPFELGNVLKLYNILQITYNGLLLASTTYLIAIHKPYTLSCLVVLPQDHSFKNAERILTYLYYLNKILDMLDTVFFVLRKNYRQVTVLHVGHHAIMVLAVYTGIRFNGYGGHFMVMGILNVFVHIVMYIYYYLSSASQAIKRSLWWKKYITLIQMVQFVLIFAHSVWTHMQPTCEVSSYAINLELVVTGFMLVMFSNFYIHSYIMPKKIKQK